MIFKMLVMFFSLLIFGSCASKSNYFANKEGCFLLYNLKSDKFEKIVGGDTCHKSYPPFSTFKVPLAVMAFDSGVLKDENEIIKWNGVRESREEANQDHNAKTWMRDSIVWFSQRITPKLGKDRFQKYLNEFDYGDKDLSEGITTAWITSPASGKGLKISPYGQIDFMKKLWKNQLPVSQRAMKLTQDITFLETSPKGYRFSGKTGSNFFDQDRKVRMGWFVSHIQKGDTEYVSVVNFKDLGPTTEAEYGGAKAKEITKKFLNEQNLW